MKSSISKNKITTANLNTLLNDFGSIRKEFLKVSGQELIIIETQRIFIYFCGAYGKK